MKKLLLAAVIAITFLSVSSCGNNKSNAAGSASDSVNTPRNITNPPDNNSATNPSLADTAYSKDSTRKPADSARMK